MSKFETSPGIGIGRINPYRVAELPGSFFIIPQLEQGHTEVIMRISVCWGEPHRLGKLLYRFGELMRIRKDPADFRMGHDLIGLDGQRKTEFVNRVLLQSLPGQNNT